MFPGMPTEANRGPNLLIAEWLTVALALITVGLRVHGRCISLNIPGWDDHTILAATLFALAQAVISIIQVDKRFGQHAATLSHHEISATIMWTTINGMLQVLGTLLVRLSCCLLVLRMPPVGHTKQLHARAIYLLMVFFVLISTASFFLLCFHCTPMQGLWDKAVQAHCIPMNTWVLVQKVDGIFEVVMNFLTASLPFIFLLNLKTRLRDKWGVLTIAFLAYGTAGASICRVFCGTGPDDDPSWGLACVEICLSVEQNVGIVLTSIPTLGDPFLIFLNHTRTSFLGKYFWPDPPLPSCWGSSQSDDIHLQSLPNFPDWQFDCENDIPEEDAEFWHAVDSQMGGLSFDACALPQKAYYPSKPNSRQSSKTRSRWGRPTSRWGSRSSSPKPKKSKSTTPKGTPPASTTPKGTPPKSTTPTATPPKSTTPKSTTPKSTTPKSTTPITTPTKSNTAKSTAKSSKNTSRKHSRLPSADRSQRSSGHRSFRSRISRPSSWIRWSWKTGDDPGYEP